MRKHHADFCDWWAISDGSRFVQRVCRSSLSALTLGSEAAFRRSYARAEEPTVRASEMEASRSLGPVGRPAKREPSPEGLGHVYPNTQERLASISPALTQALQPVPFTPKKHLSNGENAIFINVLKLFFCRFSPIDQRGSHASRDLL